jgi:putative nucleotidyltransferase with HDIG domain
MTFFSLFGKRKSSDKNDQDGDRKGGLGLKEVRIPADKLRLGMRVTRLDIPWEQTRFLFQGVEVNTLEEIEYLRQTCHFVYVDALRNLPDFEPGEVTSDVTGAGSPRARQTYINKCTLEEELPHAKESYTKLQENFFGVLHEVKKSDFLDVEQIRPQVEACVESIVNNPSALFWLSRIKNRDVYTAEHCLRVCILAVSLGREMGVSRADLDTLGLAGLLHDVGKMKVPDAILNKPARLDDDEMDIMRQHSILGAELLMTKQGLPDIVAQVALLHHERISGEGYPRKLSGTRIPLFARLVSIVDAYDAMTSERCYKDAMTSMDALSILYKCRGTDYDEPMVEAFIRLIGIYPPGSLVELNSGEVALVISNNQSRLRPLLMIRLDAEKAPVPRRMVDLSNVENAGLTIVRSLPGSAYGLNLLKVIEELSPTS